MKVSKLTSALIIEFKAVRGVETPVEDSSSSGTRDSIKPGIVMSLLSHRLLL